MHWLGKSLVRQGGYNSAEALFEKALERREKILGLSYEDPFKCMHWFDKSIFHRARYEEAETLFEHALGGQEKVLGLSVKDTLKSMHWFWQVSLSTEAIQARSHIFFCELLRDKSGPMHEDALYSTQQLGCSLYQQYRAEEAQILFLKSLEGRE